MKRTQNIKNATNHHFGEQHERAQPVGRAALRPRQRPAAEEQGGGQGANANAVPNSPMKKKRKRKPVYSTMSPATSSDSATGMSKGGWGELGLRRDHEEGRSR